MFQLKVSRVLLPLYGSAFPYSLGDAWPLRVRCSLPCGVPMVTTRHVRVFSQPYCMPGTVLRVARLTSGVITSRFLVPVHLYVFLVHAPRHLLPQDFSFPPPLLYYLCVLLAS